MAKRTCSVASCERPYVARGWCRLHYDRWKSTGDPLGMRQTGRPRVYDVTGQVFGRLTVRGESGSRPVRWICDCECGNTILAPSADLRLGHTKSCGCLRDERIGALRRTHGLSDTREHKAWMTLRTRCANPNNGHWDHYGGRGIAVAPEWDSFEQFLADMGPCPEGMSIDRIDNDGPYAPGNCRWATMTEQARNKSNNVRLMAFGETKTMTEWMEDPRCAIRDRHTLRARLNKGWTVERALTSPPRSERPSRDRNVPGVSADSQGCT